MPLFSGESVPHILADVLKSEPDWSRLPKNLHPRLKQLLERCLEKRVRDRYHSIADARVDIEKVLNDPCSVTVAPVTTQHPRRRGLSPAVAVVATAGLAALVAWRFWPSPAPKAVNRFSYVIPDDQSLGPTQAGVIALSPDGRRFVYNTTRGLYRREMGELEARLIPGTEQLPLEPFFSPDGKSIGYWGFGPFGLRRIGVEGGASVPVVSLGELRPPLRESWGADGAVYYAFFGGKGIYRIPATGGEPKLIVRAAEDEGLFAPRLLPDRDSLLFVVVTNPRNIKSLDGDIVVQSLATGERKTLISGGADARYVPTGHIVYVSGDTLFGVAFDLETLSVSGGPEPLVEGISRGTGNGSANYDVAENGTLVYLTGDVAGTARTLVWVDRGGREEPLNLPPRNYQHVELSPDGHSLALEIADQESDIWIFDRDSKTLRRLTLDSGVNRGGIWSPDGKRVVFTRQRQDGRDEIDWQAADGSGVPEPLLADSRMLVAPSDVTPDGTALLYSQAVPPRDILMLPIGRPDTEPVPLLARPASEFNAQVSPNGRWLAYQSSESESQIYVVPFPAVDSGAGWQISSKMGMQPRWSRDGRELFYLVPQPDGSVALMAVPIESEPSFRVTGLPVKLFEGNYVNSPGNRTAYDVSPDGQRFLMLKEAGRAKSGSPPRIVVVENWFEELKRRVPTK